MIPLPRLLPWLAVLAIVALVVAIPDPREFARERGARQRISIATGGTGGVWYPYGGGVAKIVSERVPNVEATAEVTGASVDNLRLIAGGQVELGFASADVLGDAYHGTGTFAEHGRVPVRTLAVLYPQITQVVVWGESPVRRVAELRGRVVSLGSAGSGTEVLALRLLRAAGLDPERDVRAQRLSVAESVNALRDGKIDAFFWSSGLPAGAVLDLASTPGRRIRLLPTAELLPAMERAHGEGVYYALEIPAGTYPGMEEGVPTIAFGSALAVAAELGDELVYEITRALFRHQPELAAIHPEAEKLSPAAAVRGSPIPYHPGAERFYREGGVWPR